VATDSELLAYLTTPKPRPFSREIREIRAAIRQTHRKIKDGTLDFQTGATLLVRLTNSLARLQLAEHQIAPREDNDPWKAVRRLFNRILIDKGLGPPEDDD
jgi:hypothetical protein